MPRETASLEQVARRIEVDLGAELEILFGAAGDERREMEYDADLGCDERARELRIGDVAADGVRERHARLVGRDDIAAERAHQRGTDVARRSGDEYSHGRSYSIKRRRRRCDVLFFGC